MSPSPVNVLFVDHAEAIGGAEESLLVLLRHLDRSKVRPHLATNEGLLARAARDIDVPTWVVHMPRIRGQVLGPWRLVRGTRELANLVKRNRIQLVHSNVMRASFYAALAARLTRLPLVWHARDIYSERWYASVMCRLADRIIAVSRAAAAPIPCGHHVDIIYNGVDPAPFDDADGRSFRREVGVSCDQPLIGIVGRVWPWKGHRLFLEAAAQIAKVHPLARFVVVGDVLFPSERNYRQEIEALASQLGLSDRMSFTGYRRDIPEVMAGLDVLVHTSHAEPFGRVLIEAMAASRPVVAFAAGGVTEVVVHGETGLLVQPGSVTELVDALNQLLQAPDRRMALGQAGRRLVAQMFSADQMARQVESVYDRMHRYGYLGARR